MNVFTEKDKTLSYSIQQNESYHSKLYNLPDEVLVLIFKQMEDDDLYRLRFVCKKFKEIIETQNKLLKYRIFFKLGCFDKTPEIYRNNKQIRILEPNKIAVIHKNRSLGFYKKDLTEIEVRDGIFYILNTIDGNVFIEKINEKSQTIEVIKKDKETISFNLKMDEIEHTCYPHSETIHSKIKFCFFNNIKNLITVSKCGLISEWNASSSKCIRSMSLYSGKLEKHLKKVYVNSVDLFGDFLEITIRISKAFESASRINLIIVNVNDFKVSTSINGRFNNNFIFRKSKTFFLDQKNVTVSNLENGFLVKQKTINNPERKPKEELKEIIEELKKIVSTDDNNLYFKSEVVSIESGCEIKFEDEKLEDEKKTKSLKNKILNHKTMVSVDNNDDDLKRILKISKVGLFAVFRENLKILSIFDSFTYEKLKVFNMDKAKKFSRLKRIYSIGHDIGDGIIIEYFDSKDNEESIMFSLPQKERRCVKSSRIFQIKHYFTG